MLLDSASFRELVEVGLLDLVHILEGEEACFQQEVAGDMLRERKALVGMGSLPFCN